MPLFGDPSVGVLSGNLASTAATVGTSNTALLTVDIPANVTEVGQSFRLSLFGTSSASGTVTFRVHAGSNGSTSDTQVWQSITSVNQANNQRAGFDGLLTVRAIGTGGTVQCEGLGFAHTAVLPTVVNAATAPTVNTTNIWSITLAVACSNGIFTAQQAVVEAL